MTLWHRSNVIIYCNSSKPIRLKHTTTQQRRSFERWSQPRRWTTSGECDNKKVAVYFTGNVFLFATLSQIQKLLTTPYCSFLFIFFESCFLFFWLVSPGKFQWRLYEQDFMLSLKPELIHLLHYSPGTNTRCPRSRHQYFSERRTPLRDRRRRKGKHSKTEVGPKLALLTINIFSTWCANGHGSSLRPMGSIGPAATNCFILEVRSESHQIKGTLNETALKYFFFNV